MYSRPSDILSRASAEGSRSKIEEMWNPSVPFKFGLLVDGDRFIDKTFFPILFKTKQAYFNIINVVI